MLTFQENNLRASRADSLALVDVVCIPQTLQTTSTGVSLDKTDVAKKVKPKASKTRVDNQTPKSEKELPCIAVSAYDNDGKLSRSFSTYN